MSSTILKKDKKAKKEFQTCMKVPLSVKNIQKEHTLRYRLDKLKHKKIHTGINMHMWNRDRNTMFFHASATQRKRVNKINRLRQKMGYGWKN
jgi:hypothetical protein